MSEVLGKQFIADGFLQDIAAAGPYLGKMERVPSIYEVIRVEEGVPLFFGDYMERLANSFSLMGMEMPVPVGRIGIAVKELVLANGHRSGPVKLVFGTGDDPFFIAFIMKPHLPAPSEYRTGVRTVFLRAMRQRPNLKMWNRALRDKAVALLAETGAYEAILVDREGFVTEASRSNVFFIKGEELFTTDERHVLPGITRKKVLEMCRTHGITVRFSRIPAAGVGEYGSCFLTGTARKIVPVRYMGEVEFEVGTETMNRISSYFEDYVAEYVRLHGSGFDAANPATDHEV